MSQNIKEDTFIYEWQDDSSYVGHATQSYINEPVDLVVIDDTISVPMIFLQLNLREEYGIILSNEKKNGMMKMLSDYILTLKLFYIVSPKTGDNVDFENGENLNSIWLTDEY